MIKLLAIILLLISSCAFAAESRENRQVYTKMYPEDPTLSPDNNTQEPETLDSIRSQEQLEAAQSAANSAPVHTSDLALRAASRVFEATCWAGKGLRHGLAVAARKACEVEYAQHAKTLANGARKALTITANALKVGKQAIEAAIIAAQQVRAQQAAAASNTKSANSNSSDDSDSE